MRRALLQEAPEALLSEVIGFAGEELEVRLRVAKRRAALLIALADLGGRMAPGAVTLALSRFAGAAIAHALDAVMARLTDRGKIPDAILQNPAPVGGLVVLAMGKLGAGELNYSSDIDLIVLFDESGYDPADYGEVRAAFVAVTKALVKALSAQTSEGYVFRTDLRLRPNPSVTPVCMAMEPAERYYESLGRTWERAAMIKAAPLAGDIAAGEAFLERLAPFVWRRHLDFAAIADAQGMLLKIREHKGLKGPIMLPGHDLKLGRGGIREIEFFAQTHQMIFGGRNPALRDRTTLGALDALAEEGVIDPKRAEALAAAYTEHRQAEHRLQMIEDAQTHDVPEDPERFRRFAHLSGWADAAALAEAMTARLETVHGLTDIATEQDAPPEGDGSGVEALLAEAEAGWQMRPVFRSERARQIYGRVRPGIAAALAETADPKETLAALDRFMSALPSGVQLFSLLEARPSLLALLMDVFSVSPALAGYLGQNARVIDSLLDADFFEALPDAGALTEDLASMLGREADFEARLDAARRWQKDQHFRAGVHLLRRIADPAEAARAYTAIAEASLAALFPQVVANFAERYGPPPGRGAAVIAMGKLGTQEMTASSDLDLIVVYDAAGETESTGRKPLSTSAYFARFTQALIAAMTAPTAEGQLYEVDMRLRPSGRQGPVAVSLGAFATYQRKEAWTWETLALTRARVIAGAADLAEDVSEAIASGLRAPRAEGKVLADVAEMRTRLSQQWAGAERDPWSVKEGRGRMMDIELTCTGRCGAGRCGGADRCWGCDHGAGEGPMAGCAGGPLA